MAGFTYNPFTYAAYTPGKYEKSKDVLAAEKKKAEAEKALAGLGDFTESNATKGILQKKTDAEKALANYGDFSWAKQGDYDKLLSDYQNRKDFSYDFNADALYQQYKDKYIQQGKMAMADTMGQAAAMTGGYGNSYAATVGNQAYQAQLQNLNDIIPELYQMALDRYNQQGQDMLNMIGLMGNERSFDYGVWGDKYNQLAADRSYYGSEYDSSWARDFSTYGDKYNRLATDRGYYAGEADNAFNRDYGVWSDSEDRRWNQYDSDRNLAHSEHTTKEGYRYQTGRDAVADEQWAKNYALSQEELALKKNSVTNNGGSKDEDGGSGGIDYSDWEYKDWSEFITSIVVMEKTNGNKDPWGAVDKEIRDMMANGLIPDDMKGTVNSIINIGKTEESQLDRYSNH